MAAKKLQYHFQSPDELYRCYMQFLVNEGIFIPTQENFSMRELLEVSIKLPNDDEFYFESEVVWVTPVDCIGFHSVAGVGIEFPRKQAQEIIASILIVLGNFELYKDLFSYTLRAE